MALKQDGAHLVLCISLCGATLSTQKNNWRNRVITLKGLA